LLGGFAVALYAGGSGFDFLHNTNIVSFN